MQLYLLAENKKDYFELSELALLGCRNAENIEKRDEKGNYFKKYYAFCRIFWNVKIAAIWTLLPDKQKVVLNSFSLKLLTTLKTSLSEDEDECIVACERARQKCEKRNRVEIIF